MATPSKGAYVRLLPRDMAEAKRHAKASCLPVSAWLRTIVMLHIDHLRRVGRSDQKERENAKQS